MPSHRHLGLSTVRKIKHLLRMGASQEAIATYYALSPRSIWSIQHGRTYKQVPWPPQRQMTTKEWNILAINAVLKQEVPDA